MTFLFLSLSLVNIYFIFLRFIIPQKTSLTIFFLFFKKFLKRKKNFLIEKFKQ